MSSYSAALTFCYRRPLLLIVMLKDSQLLFDSFLPSNYMFSLLCQGSPLDRDRFSTLVSCDVWHRWSQQPLPFFIYDSTVWLTQLCSQCFKPSGFLSWTSV